MNKSGSDLMDHTGFLVLGGPWREDGVDGTLAIYICLLNIQHYVHQKQVFQRCFFGENNLYYSNVISIFSQSEWMMPLSSKTTLEKLRICKILQNVLVKYKLPQE